MSPKRGPAPADIFRLVFPGIERVKNDFVCQGVRFCKSRAAVEAEKTRVTLMNDAVG